MKTKTIIIIAVVLIGAFAFWHLVLNKSTDAQFDQFKANMESNGSDLFEDVSEAQVLKARTNFKDSLNRKKAGELVDISIKPVGTWSIEDIDKVSALNLWS